MKATISTLLPLICVSLFGASLHAATNYWDLDGANPGAGGATPAGTWDTGTTANWSTDATGGTATIAWTDNDDAIFSAGADATGSFAVNVSGTPTVGTLTVEEGAITISGGTALNIGGGMALKGIIDVLPSRTLTISSAITGGDNSGSITKGISGGTGTGTLVLNGANTYQGQTTVRVGTLIFDSIGNVNDGPSALGNPADNILGQIKLGGSTVGATLKYTGAGHSTDRSINLTTTTGTTTIDASGSGPISFTNAIGVVVGSNGNKQLIVTGTNTADNQIAGTIPNSDGGQYTKIEKLGAGTWVFAGVNTFSGVCDIRDGTLVVNSLANKGVASSVGTGSAGTAHDIIGLGGFGSTNATLRYLGTGHSTSRPFRLWGATTNGGGTIDASGTGPLVLRGDITRPPADIYDKVLTLKGSNTDTNTIASEISDSLSGLKTYLVKEGPGKWVFTRTTAYSGTTLVKEGTLLVNSLGSIRAESAVSVNPGATFGGSGTVHGPVTVAAGATLSPGASVGTLTLNNNLILAGDVFIELDKSLSPSNDLVTVAGTLTNAGNGSVIVTNLGPALAAGDSFQIFSQALSNGAAMTIVSAGDVVWTNKLAEDGSIAVLSAGTVPAPVPATNLTIAAVGPTSFSLGGMGAANSAYNVYASTNVALPMTNWWLIGTTNSDVGGVIQFLDPQATNEQRFYRFGQ